MATKTEEVLAATLTENTGRSILDSGDAYGRNWERNQGRTVEDFLDAPAAYYGVGCVTLDLFHWLRKRLEYSPKWQKRYDKFVKNEDRQHTPYMTDMYDFCAKWAGEDNYRVDNSYNYDNALSQDIQYATFFDEEEGQDVILLQIHGGADIRGGYTAPKAFYLDTDSSSYFGSDWNDFCLNCPKCETWLEFRHGEFIGYDGIPMTCEEVWGNNDPFVNKPTEAVKYNYVLPCAECDSDFHVHAAELY